MVPLKQAISSSEKTVILSILTRIGALQQRMNGQCCLPERGGKIGGFSILMLWGTQLLSLSMENRHRWFLNESSELAPLRGCSELAS